MASFDPLASSQINVDPSLKPKPSKELAARRQQLIEMFMSKGMDAQTAAQEADRYMADYPVATGQQVAAPAAPVPPAPVSPRDAMEADLYSQGYSEDEARKQADLQEKMRAEREAQQLQQDLSQGGYGQRRVPGPRDLSGNAPMGAPFASVEEGRAYDERQAAPGMPGLYAPSQRDLDMQARGFVPVYTPDGRVTYRLEAVDGSMVPGAPGRAGTRQDLTGPRPDGSPGPYRRESMEGPTGGMQVLVPTDETRARAAAVQQKASERQAARNPYSAQNLPSVADRMKRFQAQIQLGGGRLSPQAIQLETMLNGMTPEQRQRSLQYMAPGGELAAQVDARNLDMAARLAGNAIVGAAAANPAAAAAAEAAKRKADPAAAGASDVSSGKYDTPEAQAELDRLAESYDTTWTGFSYENERSLAAALQKPPYNMPQAEAEATAYRLAEKRRFVSGNGPAGAGRPAGGAAPLPPGFVPPV
jgi:hypothetical protein